MAEEPVPEAVGTTVLQIPPPAAAQTIRRSCPLLPFGTFLFFLIPILIDLLVAVLLLQ